MPNTESTTFFASLLIIILEYSMVLFVGLVVLLFLIKKWIRSDLPWFFLCLMFHIFIFSSVFSIAIDDFFWFVESVIIFSWKIFFFLIYFFIDSYVRMLYLWRVWWLFRVRDVWEPNSFILFIQIYCRIIVISTCKSRLWIYRPLIFEWNFDLLIWSSARLCYLFIFVIKYNFPLGCKNTTENH